MYAGITGERGNVLDAEIYVQVGENKPGGNAPKYKFCNEWLVKLLAVNE